ncbi:hypothetical protein DPMN_055883 [Dreissena polymorpha]|uniref:Uncharacterized protein n=1 Tax=Dreissena polymorpha TaxID=45954 RepID=A0A9D4CTF9_DREPO|nr:hypothetical protein DPMN_055883 [Dreissena polymorpha]
MSVQKHIGGGYQFNEFAGYREILKLSNSLVYEGRLQCGSEAVATQTLAIPHPHMACQVYDLYL